ITPEYLTTITRQISEKGEDIVMSTAMKLREEGKLETAQKMLLKGFSVKEIAEITGISEKEIASLKMR
ncbi:MAG: transposase, partial [Spirochaetes bacterium]|nr:transposase [Spirochaetota bacterium]MBN2769590.1 transposase [Spirochaetota bacterium]